MTDEYAGQSITLPRCEECMRYHLAAFAAYETDSFLLGITAHRRNGTN